MSITLRPSWPRRAALLVLGAMILAGALLLLSLVMELREPGWSRTAIALQLIALAIAGALLGADWPLSLRFVVYPLVLAAVIYLWDTSLPPPSLPEGRLRAAVPHLALLGMAADAALLLWRRGSRALRAPGVVKGAGASLQRRAQSSLGRSGRRPALQINGQPRSAAELVRTNGRLAHSGRSSWARLVSRQAASRRNGRVGRAVAGPPASSRADMPSGARDIFRGVLLFLSAVVTLAPGVELHLIAEGLAPSAAIFGCVQPWAGWSVAGAAFLDLLALAIAVWVLPALRRTALLSAISGGLVGVGVGLLLGDPCV